MRQISLRRCCLLHEVTSAAKQTTKVDVFVIARGDVSDGISETSFEGLGESTWNRFRNENRFSITRSLVSWKADARERAEVRGQKRRRKRGRVVKRSFAGGEAPRDGGSSAAVENGYEQEIGTTGTTNDGKMLEPSGWGVKKATIFRLYF
uniref:Uncharacterized protein n=1 Tax=Steinernema glaseri TaxID=37863 RepID=A0A1I7Z1Y7_9BILA